MRICVISIGSERLHVVPHRKFARFVESRKVLMKHLFEFVNLRAEGFKGNKEEYSTLGVGLQESELILSAYFAPLWCISVSVFGAQADWFKLWEDNQSSHLFLYEMEGGRVDKPVLPSKEGNSTLDLLVSF